MSKEELLLKQTELVVKEDAVKKEKISPELSENAIKVINKRYLLKDRNLKPLETPEKMFHRVAKHIAQADKAYGKSPEEIKKTEEEFYEILAKLEFLPNSPTFTGAGTQIGQLAACFVLPIEDDMKSILKTQMDMGLIHKSGGGTGFSFSRLRPKNDVVGSTGGISSGPLGFLQMYNDTTECIKQGGTRRGANMGILRIDHPNILDFIDYKEKEGTLSNFNISVALTQDFMEALEKDEEYELFNPRDKKAVSKLKAREVFDKIIDGAWRNGEPGIIFLDKINSKNPTPQVGEIEATNPCVAGDTLVSTENGLIQIKELAENNNCQILTDEIVFGNFKPNAYFNGPIALLEKSVRKLSLNKITRAVKTGKKQIYKLTTESGYEVSATADHKFYTNNGWIALKDIIPNFHQVYIQPGEGYFNTEKNLPFQVKNIHRGKNGQKYVLNLPSKWSKELGEMIGLIIGDGWLVSSGKNCRVGLTFSNQDRDVMAYAQKILNSYYLKDIKPIKRDSNVYHLSYHSKYLMNFFNSLGILSCKAGQKQVPKTILQSPKESIIGFLRGLFSADGTICWNKNNNTRCIRLTSKSKKLLQDSQMLLLNLGIKSKIYFQEAEYSEAYFGDEGLFEKNCSVRNTSQLTVEQVYNRSRDLRYGFPYTNVAGKQKLYELDGQLYELHIAKQSLRIFLEKIGFLNKKHQNIVQSLVAANFYNDQFNEKVIKIENNGIKEVFDLTEPYTQSFIANGIVISNCGEQPLLPYESCNLGAINLKKFAKYSNNKAEIDWEKLDKIMPIVVHFMDNVIDANRYPIPEIEQMTKQNRKIGITVMGFADLLYNLNIAYDSEEGIKTAEKIMSFIAKRSHEESSKLAQSRGVFPNFEGSIWDKKNAPKIRNAATTSCNPTGTLSIIGSCSSGIEPFFALAYTKTVMDNIALPEVNEHFLKISKKRGFYSDDLMKKILATGNIQEVKEIPADIKKVFKVASDISPQWHVKMQAAFQKYTDGAISKTINFPNCATREDVEQAYLLAYELECKGLTVYRDGSRNIQVLTTGDKEKEQKNEEASQTIVATSQTKITPRERPNVIHGYTYRIKTAYGKLFVTINDDEDGQPFEVFSHLGKAGGFFAAKAEAICRLISLALRSGINAEEVIDQLKGIRGPTPTWSEDGRMILSLPDAISQILEKHLNKSQVNLNLEFKNEDQPKAGPPWAEKTDQKAVEDALMSNGFSSESEKDEKPVSLADMGEAPACPECGAMLEIAEGCLKCHLCGYSKCG